MHTAVRCILMHVVDGFRWPCICYGRRRGTAMHIVGLILSQLWDCISDSCALTGVDFKYSRIVASLRIIRIVASLHIIDCWLLDNGIVLTHSPGMLGSHWQESRSRKFSRRNDSLFSRSLEKIKFSFLFLFSIFKIFRKKSISLLDLWDS